MGMSAVQFRIMPESPDTDLDEIAEISKIKIKEKSGMFSEATKEPIAFGLKALVISFAYPEEKEIDELGNELEEIPGVSSLEMIDYRRAIG